ncbi:MAG TPA: BTAD domain-containing putative transcriptional regulator, partial [Chthonomonadales bacterium]|nr:BTAD domain-containing putative transcriptional regulator [Chthonomonadales bacterium]
MRSVMTGIWRISLFGQLRARRGETCVTHFATARTAALLGYLALFRRRGHTRENLAELLWPEAELDSGRASLRTALSSLRRILEPEETGQVILADRATIQLNPELVSSDVSDFERALRAASKAGEAAERVRLLSYAAGLFQGELLSGLYDEWILTERDRLNELHLNTLSRLIHAWRDAGDLEKAIGVATRLVRLDPLKEEAHYELMRLYAAAGRPAAVARQFQELDRRLQAQLGQPASAYANSLLRSLQQSASQVESAGNVHSPSTQQESSSLSASPARAARLPSRLTRFFGRHEELARLEQLLAPSSGQSARLVTITGVGGAGKTRLAVESCALLARHFPERIWFVPLADLRTSESVPQAISSAMRLNADQSPLDRIIDALAGSPALLALDNFEQLLQKSSLEPGHGAAAQTVADLLSAAPELSCLVTSRRPLEIEGERILPLQPLPTPKLPGTPERLAEFASVQLFTDRAQAARPDFLVTPANAVAVAQLCRKLEGIPLAIELASAWVNTLSPAQILDRLANRFVLLVSKNQGVPERHRTLFNAIQSSYDLLAPQQQRFLNRCSVFAGGWSLEAAEAICGDPAGGENHAVQMLMLLQNRSLIASEEVAAEMRYRLLEAVRDFAAGRLTPADRASL